MLSSYIQKVNCQTYHSQADADLLIVQKAVESARNVNTVLVGDATDLLAKRMQQHFVHPRNPWCDTTSRVHGIGKEASLKKFLVSHHFRNQAQVFNVTSASKKDVGAAGEKVLVCLCNGKSDEGLDSLRY